MDFPKGLSRHIRIQDGLLLAVFDGDRFLCLGKSPYIKADAGRRVVHFVSNTLAGGPPYLGEKVASLPLDKIEVDGPLELVFRAPSGALLRMVPLTPQILGTLVDRDIAGLTEIRENVPSGWDQVAFLDSLMPVPAEYVEAAVDALEIPLPDDPEATP